MLMPMGVKMQRNARRGLVIAAAVLALAAIGLAVLLVRGPEPGGIDDAYAALFGKADLGRVDFSALKRRTTPNDALACPADVCPGVPADIASPDFAVSGDRLREIIAAVAASEPGTQLIFSDRWDAQDRYLVRSRLMRFPDTVDALVVGRGEGRSTVALYSRSQVGYSDLGVNRARIARWLERIGESVSREARP